MLFCQVTSLQSKPDDKFMKSKSISIQTHSADRCQVTAAVELTQICRMTTIVKELHKRTGARIVFFPVWQRELMGRNQQM